MADTYEGLTLEQWASCKHDFNIANLLASLANRELGEGRGAGLAYNAIKWMATIAYMRPFGKNNDVTGERDNRFQLPLDFMMQRFTLPVDEAPARELHRQIHTARDTAIAHSDQRSRQPFYDEGTGEGVDWYGASEQFIPDEYLPLILKVSDKFESVCLAAMRELRSASATPASSGSGQRLDGEPALEVDEDLLRVCTETHFSELGRAAQRVLDARGGASVAE